MEYLTGLVVALAILLMGVEIGKSSLEKIFSPEVTTFSWMAVVILFLSILVKLWMFFFNRTLGRPHRLRRHGGHRSRLPVRLPSPLGSFSCPL